MKISKEVKVLLGLAVVVVAYNYLTRMSKKNWQVAGEKPKTEPTKSFTNLAGGSTPQVTVVNGTPYYCAKGELLQDASGVLGCYIQNRDGDMQWVGRPIIAQTPTTAI